MRMRPAVAVLILSVSACSSASSRDVSISPVGPAPTAQTATSTTTSSSESTATTTPGTSTTAVGAVTTAATTLPPVTPAPTVPTVPTVPTRAAAPSPAPMVWKNCGSKIECSTLVVPLDYANPADGQTIALKVKRRRAWGASLGPLLVNPGGPGVGGSLMVDSAEGYFDAELLRRFDLIAWDPRGTGGSDGIVCLDDVDQFLALDPTPDTPAEVQAIIDSDRAFAAGCNARSGRVLPFVSTEESARDIDQIRQALGVEQITYFGFSYGSRLGATYATLFPSRVRAMVIDGAEDPTATGSDLGFQQVVGFERAFGSFLNDCAATTACPFRHGGDPGTAFQLLMEKLDASPLTVRANRTKVTQGVAINAVAAVLYADGRWPLLAKALTAAERGDGSGLLALYDSYTRRNSPGEAHLFDAFTVITCLDNHGATDAAEAQAAIDRAVAAAPRLGRYLTSPSIVCSLIKPLHPQVVVTGKGAGPILVVGTTGDPATPYDDTVKMAKALDEGVLLTVKANQHTGYNANACASAAIDTALITQVLPEPGTVCG
jgi:pimeloyl-ACP methyl ester carboxylesterase